MRDDYMVFVWILIGTIVTIIGVFIFPNIINWYKDTHIKKINKKTLKYFKTSDFSNIRDSILHDVIDFNEYNLYLGELKHRLPNIGSHENTSKNLFNKDVSRKHIINCDIDTLYNVKNNPFDLLCDNFDIKISNITFKKLEELYNMYLSIETGHKLLKEKRAYIISKISNNIPDYAKENINFLYEKLHFDIIDEDNYFPQYIFKCKNQQIDIIFNQDNLLKFIQYLANKLNITPIMSKQFRTDILKRDGFTCNKCKISNLVDITMLFEIVPIKPITLGGNIESNNYATYCWKCNRDNIKQFSTIKIKQKSKNNIKLNIKKKQQIKLNIKKKKKRIKLNL